MLNLVTFCKILQTFTDVLCLCLGLTSFTGLIVTKSGKQNDPRLILGEACLESDSAGFVKMFIIWGMTLVAAVTCNSVLGLYSTIRQKWVLLYGYSLLAYVLTLLELLFFLTLYTHMGRVVEYSSACLQLALVEHYQGPFHSELTKFTGVWDYLQQYYGCCGVDGGKVFNSMVNWDRTWLDKYRDPFFNTTLRLEEFRVITVLPYTCCKFKDVEENRQYQPAATVADVAPLLADPDCPSSPTTLNSHTEDSCLDVFSRFLTDTTFIVFSLSIVLEVLQLAAALAAFYVSKARRNKKLRIRLKRKGLIW